MIDIRGIGQLKRDLDETVAYLQENAREIVHLRSTACLNLIQGITILWKGSAKNSLLRPEETSPPSFLGHKASRSSNGHELEKIDEEMLCEMVISVSKHAKESLISKQCMADCAARLLTRENFQPGTTPVLPEINDLTLHRYKTLINRLQDFISLVFSLQSMRSSPKIKTNTLSPPHINSSLPPERLSPQQVSVFSSFHESAPRTDSNHKEFRRSPRPSPASTKKSSRKKSNPDSGKRRISVHSTSARRDHPSLEGLINLIKSKPPPLKPDPTIPEMPSFHFSPIQTTQHRRLVISSPNHAEHLLFPAKRDNPPPPPTSGRTLEPCDEQPKVNEPKVQEERPSVENQLKVPSGQTSEGLESKPTETDFVDLCRYSSSSMLTTSNQKSQQGSLKSSDKIQSILPNTIRKLVQTTNKTPYSTKSPIQNKKLSPPVSSLARSHQQHELPLSARIKTQFQQSHQPVQQHLSPKSKSPKNAEGAKQAARNSLRSNHKHNITFKLDIGSLYINSTHNNMQQANSQRKTPAPLVNKNVTTQKKEVKQNKPPPVQQRHSHKDTPSGQSKHPLLSGLLKLSKITAMRNSTKAQDHQEQPPQPLSARGRLTNIGNRSPKDVRKHRPSLMLPNKHEALDHRSFQFK